MGADEIVNNETNISETQSHVMIALDMRGRRACNSHSIAKVYGVPHHRPIGNWQQRLGVLIWI